MVMEDGFKKVMAEHHCHGMMPNTSPVSNIMHNSTEEPSRPSVLIHVASNLRRLRQNAGLSQQDLSDRAGVSRRMLVSIEKGDVNVSLNTLDRLAEQLGVQLYALVQPPESRDSARINEIAWAGRAPQSQARLLASLPVHQEVELWSWTLAPGEHYDSQPNPDGWHDMVVVTKGRLTLDIADERIAVPAGDFHVFESNRPVRYLNEGPTLLQFVRNVLH